MSAHPAFIGCANFDESDDPIDRDSIKVLVHAFVMSRLDYCNAVIAGSPRYITDKLQCVLNAAARLVTGTRKFDHGLSHLLHKELHWLDVSERIHYKLGVSLHRCLQYKAPEYLVDCCTPVSDISSRRHLRSATRHYLTVPRYRLSTFGRRAFSVTGPTVWNLLPRTVSVTRRLPATASDNRWKRSYFVATSTHCAVEMLHDSALYKSTIDIDNV